MSSCRLCESAPSGICGRHEEMGEQLAYAAADDWAERHYGPDAEHAFESMVYGESRWY